MLISHLLQKQKKNLTFLSRSEENVELVIDQIKELKKHMVTNPMLQNIKNQTQNPYLKAKLEDISVLYEAYEETIKNAYMDEDDVLTILGNKLEESNMFQDTIIYIDEFSGFTKQEYEIIRKLLRKAKEVNITICTDTLEEANDLNDIFYTNKQTASKLIKIAKQEQVEICVPEPRNELYRFRNEELCLLEKNMSGQKNEKYEKETSNIELFLAQNPFSEIEQVAKTIIHLVKEENYRFRDISVITKNMEQYASLITAIFTRFHIPVFADQKKTLAIIS